MGAQQYSAKNVRKLSRLTGLDLDMVWNHSGGGATRHARTAAHSHVLINVRTGLWITEASPAHYTSCPK